jgi:hypothetical protein
MTNPTFSFLAIVIAFVVSLWAAYKAWRRPDDFIEMMLAMYEDPGDLNRWMLRPAR